MDKDPPFNKNAATPAPTASAVPGPAGSTGGTAMPSTFLTLRTHDLAKAPSLSGLCAGYEGGSWRSKQLADHLMEWLPEFALKPSESEGLQSGNAVALIKQAAQTVYLTEKFKKRGEFGELLLHLSIRQVFGSVPAISKIYYKTAHNDTVKGFDAVHVIGPPDDMELWLGEAKFYNDINRAIRDVVAELKTHTGVDYLRGEFMLLKGKVDDNTPHAKALKDLLDHRKSLDEVFKRVAIPVLLTYDSDCVSKHTEDTKAYEEAFAAEISKHYESFAKSDLPKMVRIHLFLLPLNSKADLVKELDKKLKTWQSI